MIINKIVSSSWNLSSFSHMMHGHTHTHIKFTNRFICANTVFNRIPCIDTILIRDWSDGVATCYELDGLGFEPRRGERFLPFHIRPARPSGPPTVLRHCYRDSYRGVKRPEFGADQPPRLSAMLRTTRAIPELSRRAHSDMLRGDLYLYIIPKSFENQYEHY
jgi:hypothetical protein